MPTVHEVVSDSSWYPHAIDLEKGELLFLKTSAVELSAASFLDQRFAPSASRSAVVRIDDVLAAMPDQLPSRPRYIFHTAFCCSTLLARCLDYPSKSVALKEPQILMMLANYKRTKHARLSSKENTMQLFRMTSWLLFRPLLDAQNVEQKIVIKPTNTVNNIIGELLAVHAQSKAIFLHSDLQSFLISLLKKGEEGRAFGRNLFNIFQMDSAEAQQMAYPQLMRMTDMQIGAVSWHLQLENFLDALATPSAANIRSLHCDQLLAQPDEVISKVVSHLELPELNDDFEALMLSAPLGSDAKTPDQTFSANDRKAQHSETRHRYADSLDIILPWAKQLRFRHPFVSELVNLL